MIWTSRFPSTTFVPGMWRLEHASGFSFQGSGHIGSKGHAAGLTGRRAQSLIRNWSSAVLVCGLRSRDVAIERNVAFLSFWLSLNPKP